MAILFRRIRSDMGNPAGVRLILSPGKGPQPGYSRWAQTAHAGRDNDDVPQMDRSFRPPRPEDFAERTLFFLLRDHFLAALRSRTFFWANSLPLLTPWDRYSRVSSPDF